MVILYLDFALFTGTLVFAGLFIIIALLFAFTSHKNTVSLNILAFPFVFLGYAFSDFFAYELTHSEIGMLHSIALGSISPAIELLKANIIDTWVLMVWLCVFIVLESYFFYSAWKFSELMIPEVEEELLQGHKRYMRYIISIGVVYPLQIFVILLLGGIWASLHFPDVIIVHMFLSLIFSVPVSLYCIQKTGHMYTLLMAWICWDILICFII